jgi:hypothetical protein
MVGNAWWLLGVFWISNFRKGLDVTRHFLDKKS